MGAAIDLKKQGTSNAIKVLIITIRPNSLKAPMAYLSKSGYILKVAQDVTAAISHIEKDQPHLILLDWNLKPFDSKKVYRYLYQKYKIKTVAFSTERSHRATMTLMRSGIPHTVFPPINGQGLHIRIQNLLKDKIQKINSSAPQAAAQQAFKITKNADEDVIEDSTPLATMRESDEVQSRRKKKKEMYKFSTPPEKEELNYFTSYDAYSSESETTKDPNDSLSDLLETESELAGLKEALGDLASDGPDEDSILEEAQDREKRKTSSPHLESEINAQLENFNTYFDQEAEREEQSDVDPSESLGEPQGSLIYVNDKGLCGYFYLNKVSAKSKEQFEKSSFKLLKATLEKMKIEFAAPSGTMDLSAEELAEFDTSQIENFDYHSISNDPNQFSFSFLKSDHKAFNLDIPSDAAEEEMVPVEFNRDIAINLPIDFDVFIHMPKNGKFIHYLKWGTVFSEAVAKKLTAFGVKYLYIKKEQLSRYIAYDFLSQLKKRKKL